MTLPASGTLKISDLRTEFTGPATSKMTDYYKGGTYVPNTPTNSAVPTSGTIKLSNFYGASSALPAPTGTFSAANFTSTSGAFGGSYYISNNLTLTVTNGPITVTASGGTIQKNSAGSYLTSISFDTGDTIRMSVLASYTYDATVTGTASMTGDSASYAVTTESDPCFEASTLILMSDGSYKTLANIAVGDMVMGYSTPSMIDQSNPDWMSWTAERLLDGSNKPATVIYANTHIHSNYYTLNNEFKVTSAHPLLVYRDSLWQWIIVSDIIVGDVLWSDVGTEIPVTEIENITDEITVVSLDVEQVDTYFVKGANGTTILAHNK
jgi:hypothetical protein